ncbi:MAG: GGDEF domain-containing protein, partial [Myxococcota bacterium]|nr:GGDEF domain-containing protein [Myxococcota bacterium]
MWLTSDAAPREVSDGLTALRYGAVGLAVLLGWRFHRSRVIFATLTLAVGAEAMYGLGATAASPVGTAFAVSVSITLALLALTGDRGLRSPSGVLTWVVLLVEAGWILVLGRASPETAPQWLTNELVLLSAGDLLFSATVPTLLGWVGAAIVATAMVVRQGPIDSGLLGALVACVAALSFPTHGPVFHGMITVGLGVLSLSVLETTYALAYRDELTGLPSRRALNRLMDSLDAPYVLAMVDIDHFKALNDTHGHDAGDHGLRMVAFKLAAVGGGGKSFRYGGEEFTVVFARTALSDALPHLEAVREAIAGHDFVIRSAGRPSKKPAGKAKKAGKRTTVQVTVSVGAAQPSD